MTHWAHPLLLDDSSFDEAWGRVRADPILFVCGSGFDPRAAAVLPRLRAASSRRIDGWMIDLPEDATDPDVRPRADANRAALEALIVEGGGTLRRQPLPAFNDADSLGR